MSVTSSYCLGTSASNIEVGGERTYTVDYQVETNDAEDQAIAAMQAAAIPSIGTYYFVGNDDDILVV